MKKKEQKSKLQSQVKQRIKFVHALKKDAQHRHINPGFNNPPIGDGLSQGIHEDSGWPELTSENINEHYSQADFYLGHCTFVALLFLVSAINANGIILGCHKHYMACIRERTASRWREVMLPCYSVWVKHIWISGFKPGLPSTRDRHGLTAASARKGC